MQRNETWAQGAKPGDRPLFSEDVLESENEVRINARLARLRDARSRPIEEIELRQIVADILNHLDLKG